MIMEKLSFNLTRNDGKIKILNATNGGPIHKRHANDQYRSNFIDYKNARIPYSRNHDSGVCGIYGGPYSHDVSKIFTNFDADENDPNSYDFACTDEAILTCLEAGTKTFFRLGETIEHQIKKHATLPPKDFHKWARICEHIIRHYTEGWADGFYHDMPYWEIWNEPDLDKDDSPNKRCWGGTKAQFFDFYEIAAKHLKKCFPHLKIGGPALAGNLEWEAEFVEEMQKREVPLDFFSWHRYLVEPTSLIGRANQIRNSLDSHGYTKTETIFNEWNYVKNWHDKFVYSIECMHGIKGGAFMMAVMTMCQHLPIDMLMYYDTRPTTFNGAFDYYTLRPLKGYYALKWSGDLYDSDNEVICEDEIKNIYTLCAVKKNKAEIVITYYSDEENLPDKELTIDLGRKGKYEIYLVDETHDGELIETTENLTFVIKQNTFIKIKEI